MPAMNDLEMFVADEVRKAVNEWARSTERAEQDKKFVVGPSAIGFCSERLRRLLDQQVPEDPVDWHKAFIGTAVGDYLERAIKQRHPHLLIQSEFWVELEGDRHTYRIPAHSDVIDQEEGIVWDFKTKDGLTWVKRDGISRDYQFQRNLYALGAHQSGLFPNHKLEELRVGNIFYDRAGQEPLPFVQVEDFSPDAVREAIWWLEEVVDAFLAGEEATKEPPRQMCEAACGFFTKCRAFDTDVEGMIRDPKYIGAIEMYVEGNELEKEAKKMKRSAQVILSGVEGHTPTHSLRWTLVNGGTYTVDRQDYLRMSLTRKKK